jgi:hypothetical protein
VAAPDSAILALVTPWFAQVFDPALRGLSGRVRYEDAGHYFKYAALAPGKPGLLLAGAYLLDDDAGPALEARWDWWEPGPQGWVRRWARAREGAENSQLRGVQTAGGVACVELWRTGYEFEVQARDGATLWAKRGGERPVLSPGGAVVAWEDGPGVLALTRVQGGVELWRRKVGDTLRLKRPLDDGSCVALEGRFLRGYSPQGGPLGERALERDAEHAVLGVGALALAKGTHGARVELDAGWEWHGAGVAAGGK